MIQPVNAVIAPVPTVPENDQHLIFTLVQQRGYIVYLVLQALMIIIRTRSQHIIAHSMSV